MDNHTTTTPATENFAGAAYMPGMNTSRLASLTADALRQSSITPNYDSTHERVNAAALEIAKEEIGRAHV